MQKIEDPFMLAVKDALGDRFNYTVNVETTYRTTIRFILAQLSNEAYNYHASLKSAKPPPAICVR